MLDGAALMTGALQSWAMSEHKQPKTSPTGSEHHDNSTRSCQTSSATCTKPGHEVVQAKSGVWIVEEDHVADQDLQQHDAKIIRTLPSKLERMLVLGAAAAQDHCITQEVTANDTKVSTQPAQQSRARVLRSYTTTMHGWHPSCSSQSAS